MRKETTETVGTTEITEKFIIILMILCFAVVSFVSVVSVVSKKNSPSPRPNFSGEGVRCGASQKKPLRDSTQSTALGGLNFWDVPQIAAYREKLISCQKG